MILIMGKTVSRGDWKVGAEYIELYYLLHCSLNPKLCSKIKSINYFF